MNTSFHYKWEEKDSIRPSADRLEKNSTLISWSCFFLLALSGLFFAGYQKNQKGADESRAPAAYLHSISMEPFLVRISSGLDETALIKVKAQFFTSSPRVSAELKSGYKEHLIFFLSRAAQSDFLEDKKKFLMEEKIKNHINDFLSTGKIERVLIKEKFI